MQYDYFLKTDLYGNVFIEFLLENNIHGYNNYGEVFLDDLLDALGELKPSLKNDDNYWAFNLIHGDESTDDEIKDKFKQKFNPDYEDWNEVKILVIKTIYGKIILKDGDKMQILITSEKNSELILKIDTYLKNNILFNNAHSN